ncbi:nicotinate-nucleotide adenylyltransferase [Atopobacter sp. AH10]|uniref:nicotinate-nucleotide adenylyltransferase n=1 Tax=Atopobacter sp. AH10 TaxID=2315861 RepID=UPI000EF25635|nr:nicotinate-nucleotide adenylyltransferase [Atopobacter sp. AH10]RLK62926.1 nicotinate-nucleotide adenylyltransferase [Atopobacter sp. AH10]
MKVKKVGLMGGTFNPPHLGHLILADQALHQLDLDEVRLMLTHIPPHAALKRTLPIEHRLAMTRLAVEGQKGIGLETIELERDEKSYSYDTISLLKEREADTEFTFIIGGDMVEDLPNWYRIDELIQMIRFAAFERPGYEKSSAYPLIWLKAPLLDISSTSLREAVRRGESIRYLLPEKVRQYVMREGLYR